MPKFSILMLTFNRRDEVALCFASLESTLARKDVETWILDNGSTDGTADFVGDLPYLLRAGDVKTIISTTNLGVARGRADLLAHADGEVILFLDSDVLIRDTLWLDRLAVAREPE